MMEQINRLIEKFNALNERERISVTLLSVVALAVFLFEIAISPLLDKAAIIDKQVTELKTQSGKLKQQVALLETKIQQDPYLQDKRKLALLDQQITNLTRQLKEKMHGLIEPSQMAKVLEVVLTQNTNLKLQRIESLGATPLAPITKSTDEEQQDLGIYRHGLKIEFTGSYLSTLKYLQAIDKLPWDFYWDGLKLKVEKYPLSRIEITVHTLSFHEGWIGV